METTIEKVETVVPFDFPLEILKQEDQSGEFHIVGYAATSDFDMQGDIIADEALRASSPDLLKNSTVLLNHDIKRPIGRVTKAEFDKHGLLIDVLISKTEPEIIQKIKEGVLNKFSIRGEVLEREKKYMPELDRMVNVIKRMTLVEVSLVSVPANPEAKAIGWYIAKALSRSEKSEAGGDPMANKEAKKSDDPKEKTDNKAPTEDSEEKPNGGEGAQQTLAPEPTPDRNPDQEPTPEPEPVNKSKSQQVNDTLKKAAGSPQLDMVLSMLERIYGLGGEAANLAMQIKSSLTQMLTGSTPQPAAAAPKGLTEDEINKRISDEVKKQLEVALKSVPVQRKGVVQPEPESDDVKKTFEGLSPEKKLKVALALQQD